MASRLALQAELEALPGVVAVYFQPPASVLLSYPCIVYERSDIRTDHADNNPYSLKLEYTITVMDKNPDSLIPLALAMLPTADFRQHFTTENLHHDVFTLFY